MKIAVAPIVLIVSTCAAAETPATQQPSQVIEAEISTMSSRLAKSGCASFGDALHMIESDQESIRNRGSVCLKSLTELAKLRHSITAHRADQAAK